MELKEYIRVIRRRLWWFVVVIVVVVGGYLAVASVTQTRVWYARFDLFANSTRTGALFEGLRDYFPNSAKMNFETRIEGLKTKDVQELAALYLADAKSPGGAHLFARERKEAEAKRPFFRDRLIEIYCERNPGTPKEEIQERFGPEIDKELDDVCVLDPKTGRWEGRSGAVQQECVKLIANAIDRTYGVEKIEKTQLVRVTVHSDSPVKVTLIANALCEAAIQYNREFDNRELIKARADAGKRMVQNQELLTAKRTELKEYWKRNGITQNDYYTSAQFYGRIAQLQSEIDKLDGDLARLEDEQKRLDTKREMERGRFPDFSFPKDSVLSQLLNKRSEEEKDLEAMLAKYTEAHPEVKRVRRTILELKQQYAENLRKFQENDARRFSYDKAVAELERNYLKREIERKRTLLTEAENHRVEVDQKKVGEQQMMGLIQQLDDENKRLTNFLGMAELYSDSAARPLDRYRNQPLESKDAWEEPNDLYQMMWFMFAVAFLLALGVVFLMEYMDTRLKTEHDIRRHLNLPVLGIIHHQRPGDSVLLTELGTKDPFAEKFYTAATIIKSAAQDLGLRTFVVSSTIPKEGKTTISVNLAVALARKGLKVILVDSDLRIPQIHELLGLGNGYGLSSILEGRLKAKEVLADIAGSEGAKGAGIESFLQDTTVEGLKVLTSGPTPADPIHLLESVRMKALIEELKGLFDFAIFDTPPISNVGDTLCLAGVCDANIFVVGANSVEQHQVAWAKHLLSNVEANILGCFLNHATIESRAYYYYYNEYKSYRARG